MLLHTWRKMIWIGVFSLMSAMAMAENTIVIRTPDERHAIKTAKASTQGGLIVSTKNARTHWQVQLLKGCMVFDVKVAHDTRQVASKERTSVCEDGEALLKLKATAHEYRRTHR